MTTKEEGAFLFRSFYAGNIINEANRMLINSGCQKRISVIINVIEEGAFLCQLSDQGYGLISCGSNNAASMWVQSVLDIMDSSKGYAFLPDGGAGENTRTLIEGSEMERIVSYIPQCQRFLKINLINKGRATEDNIDLKVLSILRGYVSKNIYSEAELSQLHSQDDAIAADNRILRAGLDLIKEEHFGL